MKQSVASGIRWFWREWGKPLLMVAVIIAPFRASIADWYDVPTGSMRPTILDGDRVFVNKLAYDLKVPFTSWQIAKWRDPARGDVVVLKSPADEIRLVKRVIGLPGDIIEMDRNQLKVNGQIISYEPLDSKTVPQVAADERSHNRFFTEQLPGKPHSIMTIPSVRAYRSFGPIKVPEGQYFVMG
ncbi:MAG: signal peptidase I, partial [Calditrichota bacterium]